MGRLAKNPPMVGNATSAESALLPSGPTSGRPDVTDIGQLRLNITTAALEYWTGAAWAQLAETGLTPVTKDSFTGDAIDTTFTMTETVVDEVDILVFVGGVFQNPGVSFTTDGSTTITFTSPPPDSEAIVVLHGYNELV